MSYAQEMKRAWAPLAGALSSFGKVALGGNPWRLVKPSFLLVFQLFLFFIKTIFFTIKKITG